MKRIDSYHIRYAYLTDLNNKRDQYFRHVHSNYELYLFLGGNAEYVIEDRLFKLRPYSLILIKPTMPHYIKIKSPESDYERITIHFEKDIISPELFPILESEAEIFYLDKDSDIVNAYERLMAASENFSESDSSLLLNLYINEILMRLRYLSASNCASSDTVNPTVSQILKYINTNITKPLNIKTISQDLYLSPTYISHIFSKHIKISVMDYIKEKKIFLAKNLINSGVKPTEAAAIYGFENYSTFYRLYKSILKQTPSQKQKTQHATGVIAMFGLPLK